MSRNVEYTDEFSDWWMSLDESQQDDVAAIVTLLEREGRGCRFPIRPATTARVTHTCASCACKAAVIRCACSMRSIHAERPSCWLQVTRRAIVVSTRA